MLSPNRIKEASLILDFFHFSFSVSCKCKQYMTKIGKTNTVFLNYCQKYTVSQKKDSKCTIDTLALVYYI